MKRLGTISVIAALLLATAVFYRLEAGEPAADTQPKAEIAEPVEVAAEREDEEEDEEEHEKLSPTASAAEEGTLTVEAGISHGYMAAESGERVYATVDVSAKEVDQGRPPLNLAVVIDRSGSMSDDKIRFAKQAANQLVDQLEPSDRLSVVSYSNDVSVDVASAPGDEEGKRRMRRSINAMRAAGGTNISGGFQSGVRQIERHKGEEAVDRLVLLSDGQANAGITHRAGLENIARQARQKGISSTTMGMGLDYNEDILQAMADQGAGNYHFIEESDAVVSIFDSEFESLAGTVARDTSLVLSLADGVDLEELYGFSHERDDERVRVPLSQFYGGQEKNLLLELSAEADKPGERPIMDVDLSYKDVTDDDADKNQQVALTSVVTDDVELAEEEVDREVISRVQQVEVADGLEDAMAAYQRGDREEARRTLRKRQEELEDATEQYDLDESRFAPAKDELADTEKKVDETAPSSTQGKGMIKSQKKRGRDIKLYKSEF